MRFVLASILCLVSSHVSAADTATGSAPSTSVLSQHGTDWLWVSGQLNVIYQAHGAFAAPYSGDHSLWPLAEHATSRILTLFTGVKLPASTEVLVHVESAGGGGISDALGLAGFTDLDVVRNPDLGSAPYLARFIVHHTIALGAQRDSADPSPMSLAKEVPTRRLDLRVGKFGTADLFDLNTIGSDSHLQFMNWTVDNNGAYDYAADTRGYTWGAVAEYHDEAWAVRFGEMLMPKVANGLDLDWHLGRARAENVEVEFRTRGADDQQGAVRALTFVNHANMGDYRESLQRFADGRDRVPTIENTRQQGRIKYGFGLNVEEPVTSALRTFGRCGWNEPHFESFAYTEVNSSVEVGADYAGRAWRRPFDKLGAAFVSNGISSDHRSYLAHGGSGFLLGDGALRYRREDIVEAYYTTHIWRGVFASADVQHVSNPGYNHDRGPVFVPGVRLHVDF